MAHYKIKITEEIKTRLEEPYNDTAVRFKKQYVKNEEEIEHYLYQMEQRESELMEKIKKEEGRKKTVQFPERMNGKTIKVDCPIVVFKCPFCTKEMLIKKSIALNEGNVRCTGCGNVIEVFDESNMRALGS